MSTELLNLSNELSTVADNFQIQHKTALKAVIDSATQVQKSWSGSNIGHHAYVYYEGLIPRPPGAQFSAEWGLEDMSYIGMGSIGAWIEYSPEIVKEAIYSSAGNPELSQAESDSEKLALDVADARDKVLSILSVALSAQKDSFLEKMLGEAEATRVLREGEMAKAMLSNRQMVTRDMNALTAGLHIAPHQEVIAKAASLQCPADAAKSLAAIARKAGSHMSRKEKQERRSERVGTNVFIGHGRSSLWRELKDFVVGRLNLPYEEFNRVPVAGVTNISRLSEMLDGAGCAFIVLTSEDEQADGSMHARMNVIHEVGLFQGRLGFTKAIVVLEEGCEEFSNIQGLGQIRFPKGNVSAVFEDVRAVLEREEMV